MKLLPAGTIKRIHVNRSVVASNRIHGRDDPAITVQTSKGPNPARKVVVRRGSFEMVQAGKTSGRKPLSCGARIWIETKSAVELS